MAAQYGLRLLTWVLMTTMVARGDDYEDALLADLTRIDLLPIRAEIQELQQFAVDRVKEVRWIRPGNDTRFNIRVNIADFTMNRTTSKKLIIGNWVSNNLTIIEDELKTLVATIPNVRKLTLRTRALEYLFLKKLRVEILPPGFALRMPKLENITLDEVKGQLPFRFLEYASNLTKVQLRKSSFLTLPSDLFYYSPELKIIDLQRNKLIALPSGIFSQLPQLSILYLDRNQLTAGHLSGIEGVTTLRYLKLSNNPLGDLCSPGAASNLARLKHLRTLLLSQTGGTHLCKDWFQNMQELSYLEYHNNRLQSLDCGELAYHRLEDVEEPTFDLSGNNIRAVHCTREQKDSFQYTESRQILRLKLSSELACGCGLNFMEEARSPLRVLIEGLSRYNCVNDTEIPYGDC